MPRPCQEVHPTPITATCRLCWLYENDIRYRKLWGGDHRASKSQSQFPRTIPCRYEGPVLQWCHTCRGAASEMRHVRDCEKHDRCTRTLIDLEIKSCDRCEDYEPMKHVEGHAMDIDPVPLKWAYGVTTVPERMDPGGLLDRTLASLKAGGFDQPRLFIDGIIHDTVKGVEDRLGLEITSRYPKIRTSFNWILTLWELWARNPGADRFAIFQDDFITYRNLRAYLDRSPFPIKGYWNLYTFPANESLVGKDYVGWYRSNQKGLGAVGLVFDREGVMTLLSSREHIVDRPLASLNGGIGWRKIDGGIVDAMRKAEWEEWVHSPSLVQHVGDQSITRPNDDRPQPKAPDFRGEGFDAMELLMERTGTDREWEREREALIRAIADDRQRLDASTDRIERRRLQTTIGRYEDKLRTHLRASPR